MDNQLSFEDDPVVAPMRRAFERAKSRLQSSIPKPQFEKFLQPLQVEGRESHLIFVSAPGRFVQEWVRDKYRQQLEEVMQEELGEAIELVLEARLHEKKQEDLTTSYVAPKIVEDSLGNQLTFDTFVIGSSNMIAYNGAKAVCEKPGTYCNPLFIYGPTGVGKTHLLHSIAHEYRLKHPNAIIRYMTAQEFAHQFITSLEKNNVSTFRKNLEPTSILLMDDVGFLDGKSKTQEELFFLFNTMHQNAKQIVLCSDRPPREHTKIDERLRSRFECGLVADILPPDIEMRIAILKKKAEAENVDLPDECAEFLAENVPGNIRSLLGALTTLLIHHSIGKRNLNIDLAREVIEKQYGRSQPNKPTSELIIKAVAAYYNVSLDQLQSNTRKAWVVQARHVAIYLCRNALNENFKRLGERFGNRDHSSAMHGYKKIESMLSLDHELRADISAIKRELNLDC